MGPRNLRRAGDAPLGRAFHRVARTDPRRADPRDRRQVRPPANLAAADRIDRIEIGALYRRATQYAARGRTEEAVELYNHLLERGDNRNVRNVRATALATLGQWSDAAADLELLVNSGPLLYRPRYELALIHLIEGNEAAYHQVCAQMLGLFGATQDPLTAKFV